MLTRRTALLLAAASPALAQPAPLDAALRMADGLPHSAPSSSPATAQW
jgi:hypothetical protein